MIYTALLQLIVAAVLAIAASLEGQFVGWLDYYSSLSIYTVLVFHGIFWIATHVIAYVKYDGDLTMFERNYYEHHQLL